ncbi:MAG: 50S ribosomal protein L35 [Phycisphaerae bacterium]|nr:50S ribosomal protein L35 [Phycisphaerae bacterium]
MAATTKQKTHKGLRKRVKVSARGKVRYKKSFAGHLMSGKSGRRRQRLRRKTALEGAVAANVKRALGG